MKILSRFFRPLLAVGLALPSPSLALEFSGKVVGPDKKALPGVQICLMPEAKACVLTDSLGAFHSDFRSSGAAKPIFYLPARADFFKLFAMDGRRVLETLSPKPIDALAPELRGLPSGLYWIKYLSAPIAPRKIAIVDGRLLPQPFSDPSGNAPLVVPKRTALSDSLSFSKIGYLTRIYHPEQEMESGILVALDEVVQLYAILRPDIAGRWFIQGGPGHDDPDHMPIGIKSVEQYPDHLTIYFERAFSYAVVIQVTSDDDFGELITGHANLGLDHADIKIMCRGAVIDPATVRDILPGDSGNLWVSVAMLDKAN